MEEVIGHHRAFGQLFSDILVDTMTLSQPAVTENRAPLFFMKGRGVLRGRWWAVLCHLWTCVSWRGGWGSCF